MWQASMAIESCSCHVHASFIMEIQLSKNELWESDY